MNNVALNHQIFVDKIRRIIVVGRNAAHLGSGQVDGVNIFTEEEEEQVAEETTEGAIAVIEEEEE